MKGSLWSESGYYTWNHFVAISYALYSQFGIDTTIWLVVLTHIIMMVGIGAVLASVQTNTLNLLPKQYYPDGIAITQTIQQVAGAIGIAVMVSILSAKQGSYLATVANEPTQAAVTGSSLVFTFSLVLAVINVVLSLFMKNPINLKTKCDVFVIHRPE
jgi:DHA2 family lincomycin resistance protein-like MFS transporter